MSDIFISHIHEEAEAAKALLDYLKGYKLDTFLSSDNYQVRPGDKWFDRIISELDSAKIVILMLSKFSVTRPWINFEAGWAWSKHKVTIPACFGGLKPGAMPRPYSDIQGVDLMTYSSYSLVLECYERLGRFSPPPVYEDKTATALTEALKKFES